MINLRGMLCCGLAEIDGLSGYDQPANAIKDVAFSLAKGYGGNPNLLVPIAIFTGTVEVLRPSDMISMSVRKDNYVQAFADYITAHGLGKLTKSSEIMSHSKNRIVAFMWEPNYEELFAHCGMKRTQDGELLRKLGTSLDSGGLAYMPRETPRT